MVAPLACVANELEGGRLVVLGSEPHLAVRYGIVQLKSQPLTAVGVRFREYVLEAERAFTEQEQDLLERWRPRPFGAIEAEVGASRLTATNALGASGADGDASENRGYLTTLNRARRLSVGDVGFGPGSSPGEPGALAVPPVGDCDD